MQVFINENSLHEQYTDLKNFEKAISELIRQFQLLDEQKTIKKKIFKSANFNVCNPLSNRTLISCINHITDKDIFDAYFDIFQRLDIKIWNECPVQKNTTTYVCNDTNVNNTSLAEAAERKNIGNNDEFLLFNFIQSIFSKNVNICINYNDTILIDCTDTQKNLEKWLDSKYKIFSQIYDTNLQIPPTDEQTILRDRNRFTPTKYSSNKRRVYKDKLTNYYWYVDRNHIGLHAHLEVFNKNGEHIGTASLTGDIDSSKRIAGRSFDI
jgi:D-ribose pyranose/furanose isomerase RbsD